LVGFPTVSGYDLYINAFKNHEQNIGKYFFRYDLLF